MRVLEISHMFPDSKNPNWGVFIYNHVKAIHSYCSVNVRVIAPRPYSSWILVKFNPKWGNYMVEHSKKLDSMEIFYTRYPVLPNNLFGENWFTGIEPASLYISLFRRIRHDVNLFKPDLIHAHTAIPDCWAAIKWGKKYRIPVICSFRGSDINSYPYYSKLAYKEVKYVIENADLITTVSEALKKSALKISRPKKEIEVIYNGVDNKIRFYEGSREKIRKKLGFSNNNVVLIQVGSLQESKGVIESLEAFRRLYLLYPKLRLVYVGDGELVNYFKKKINNAGWTKDVFLVGRVKHDDIPHWLSAADIFVFPTYNEGMPNSLLEAMAVGLPVIASAVGGIPEVIEDGWNGLLIPPKDVESLVRALKNLLNSSQLRRYLGENAKKTIKDKFTWKRHARRICSYYDMLVE